MGISERRAELLDSRGAYGDGGMIAKPVRGIRRDVTPPGMEPPCLLLGGSMSLVQCPLGDYWPRLVRQLIFGFPSGIIR